MYLNPANVGAYAVQNPLLLTDSNLYQIEASYGTLGDGIQLTQAWAGAIKGQLLRWESRI